MVADTNFPRYRRTALQSAGWARRASHALLPRRQQRKARIGAGPSPTKTGPSRSTRPSIPIRTPRFHLTAGVWSSPATARAWRKFTKLKYPKKSWKGCKMAPADPLRVALIGTGNRSKTTYRPLFDYLKPWVEIVAVCDPVRESADEFAESIGVPAFLRPERSHRGAAHGSRFRRQPHPLAPLDLLHAAGA